MAKIDTKGVKDEDRNERKGESSAHFRLKQTNKVLMK
jgi:hypothetical protein